MTEAIMFQRVKEWGEKYSLQLDKLSMSTETKLANGNTTFAGNETSYACHSKDDAEYKTLVFSDRSLIVFAYENSIIEAKECVRLELAFMVPPEREHAQESKDIVAGLGQKK